MTETALQLQGITFSNLVALNGGRNNRVFHALGPSGDVLIKQYFHSQSDSRDRLASEFKVLSFLNDHGLNNIPRPILADESTHTGVYQFIHGTTVDSDTISEHDVISFAELLVQMWELRNNSGAQNLPLASEACFSIKEYIFKVESRFTQFSQIDTSTNSFKNDLRDFILNDLRPFFNEIVLQPESTNSFFTQTLNQSHRTLSPSDHGFHNAIRSTAGKLFFIDFEYAGWDDPVKMVCDALLQPDKPVPEKFHSLFFKTIKQVMVPIDDFLKRIEFLYPLLGVKWCLIILNEFLPLSESRRIFAGKITDDNLKRVQLTRARDLFVSIRKQFKQNYIVNTIKNSV